MTPEEKQTEIAKCKASPYYFATTYLLINGKPFKTLLSEEEFNKDFEGLYGNTPKQDRGGFIKIKPNTI